MSEFHGKGSKLFIKNDIYAEWDPVEELKQIDFKLDAMDMRGEGSFNPKSLEILAKWEEEIRKDELFTRQWRSYLWTYWQMSAIAVCAGALCLETGAWEMPDQNGLIPGYTIDF